VLTFVAASAPATLRLDALLFRRRRVAGSLIGGRAEIAEMLELRPSTGSRRWWSPSNGRGQRRRRKVRDNTVRFRAVLRVA